MAFKFTFNGKKSALPGVRTAIRGQVNNAPANLDFGNLVIIDKGESNGFGGGAGIVGEHTTGANSIYKFDNIKDFRDFTRGGVWYDNALGYFKPLGSGAAGVSNLYYVRALTTTAASATFTLTNGPTGGTIAIDTLHEGTCGNGVQGAETLASQTISIDTIGASSDTIDVVSDAGSGAVTLATYTSNGTDTVNVAMATLAAAINAGASGYSAVFNGTNIVVTAPAGSGVLGNTYTFVSNVTGTATSTVGMATLFGGADGPVTRGIGISMHAGTINSSKFVFKFWRGQFTGTDSYGTGTLPFGSQYEADFTEADLIAQSVEVATIAEFEAWAANDVDYLNNFATPVTSITGSGNIDPTDLAAYTRIELLAGGTEVYNTNRVDEILSAIASLDYNYIMTGDEGANANSVDNVKVLTHLEDDARFEKYMIVGGGDTEADFTSQSIAAAKAYNSSRVILVHGGAQIASRLTGGILRDKPASYKAAHVVGRICGLDAQTPVTNKLVKLIGEQHDLSEAQKEAGLEAGVLMTAMDNDLGGMTVVMGVNTLQDNQNVFVTELGDSFMVQLENIKSQLNKELEVNMKVKLLGNQQTGPNRNTLDTKIVEEWVKGYLESKTATQTVDNLITGFSGVVANFNKSALEVSYQISPNFEVNVILASGIIIDPNS